MLAAVAGEAVELAGDVGVSEGAAGEGVGFEDFDAAEIPAGGDELFEEGDLERALGIELDAVLGLEFGEGFLLVVANQEAASEVVPVGIAADDGFALGGAGSGGELGVGPVGCLTCG